MRNYSRYQSPSALLYNDIKPKQYITTKASFTNIHNKNPEMNLLRLPNLNSMRRSFSTTGTQRNTKFKLQNIQQKLIELASDIHNTRLEAQQTLNNIRFLKEDLAVGELSRIRQDINKQIKGLERLVKGTKTADQERYRSLKDDCGELWHQTENLRQSIFQLNMRTEQLDLGMGFQKNL